MPWVMVLPEFGLVDPRDSSVMFDGHHGTVHGYDFSLLPDSLGEFGFVEVPVENSFTDGEWTF